MKTSECGAVGVESFSRYLSNKRILKSRWALHAECKDEGPETLYPVGNKQQILVAHGMCGSCPVSQECLELALLGNEVWGVWGGTTEAEREVLLREVRRAVEEEGGWSSSIPLKIARIACDWLANQDVDA